MSIKVDLTSSDVDRQINLLNVYPEIAEKYYKPALQKDIKMLAGMIQPNIPVFKGTARRTFGSRVTGKGTSITGEVGWYRKGSPFYINFIEGGAKSHTISPRGGHGKLAMKLKGMKSSDFALRFYSKEGNLNFLRRSVQNPGISARGFMQNAWNQAQPLVENDLRLANEAIVRELALP
jgi:hypothetical protein